MLRPGPAAAKLDSVQVRAVVVQTVVQSCKFAQGNVCFRRVKVAGRRVHAQAVARARPWNFLPGADRHRVPQKAAQPILIEDNFFLTFRFILAFRKGRDRGECANLREARFGRKINPGSAFITAEWIGLIVPIEIARVCADGVIGVLRSLMIGEKAARIFVVAATFGIVPKRERKRVIAPSF